ncbi:MAG: hypothetical protein HPY81_00305 [Firmicutes bacterium]|nr:hypothetical protein [Bacillota bacterium]
MPKQFSDERKIAVALRYEPDSEIAPRVVATGQGEVAERILSLARQNNVPVHYNPDLAARLAVLDLNAVIPVELYQVVAEVLAFVYRLNSRAALKAMGRVSGGEQTLGRADG